MRQSRWVVVLALWALPAVAVGQTSQFGVRALGIPGLPFSTRSEGSAGAFGFFDGTSAINPASLFAIDRPIASMNVSQHWRSSHNPFGSATGYDANFPLFIAGGRVSSRLSGAVSASIYTDRTFALASQDTIQLRGLPVVVDDTLISRGGLSDLRAAVAYRWRRVVVGLGVHLITGTNRIEYRRGFSDSTFIPINLRNELAALATGVSAGVVFQPNDNLVLGATARMDSDLATEKDTTKTGSIPLPRTLGVGAQWTVSNRLAVGGHLLARSWSRGDEELKARGGTGASNTTTAALGLQLTRSLTAPSQLPLRLGVRWGGLPYPVVEGRETGKELGITMGTGFLMSGQRGGLDISVERIWRNEGVFTERAFVVRFGVTVRQ